MSKPGQRTTRSTTDPVSQTNSTAVAHSVRMSVNQHQTNSTPMTQSVRTSANRPDWLLYTIPSIAFVLGLLLFTMICKTQRRRETAAIRRVSAVKTNTNGTTAEPNNTRSGFTGAESQAKPSLSKQEAQSYENVSAAIYNNQDKVTYYVTQDEDYINPDAMGDYVTMQEDSQSNHLQLPHNITDADGESYENMENCVYAQPRHSAQKHTVSADDDESYENMEGNVCPYKSNLATHNSTNTLDDESYEQMDSIQPPSDVCMERGIRGESERRGRAGRGTVVLQTEDSVTEGASSHCWVLVCYSGRFDEFVKE
ncbi:uncharacterized protein [Salminus brasiliensis]|uniref:uncharacterized protein n=1 Tax=Salminus brasiliensis TaxID=930266 RepID=UPI003B831CFD